MRTTLLALVALLLPAGLYGPLAGSPAPGAGLAAIPAADRWGAIALAGAASLFLFLAYRLRTRLAGPGLAAAGVLSTLPAMVDAVGAAAWFPLGVVAAAAAGSAVQPLLSRGGPGAAGGRRGVLLGAALAAAVLVVHGFRHPGLAERGAPALGAPGLWLAPLGAVLAGETAVEILRRPALSAAARGGIVAALGVLVAAGGLLGHLRASSWGSPRAFWERAAAEAPGSPATRGTAAGLAAREGDRERVRFHLGAFVEGVARGGGAALTGAEARTVGAVGAASAAGHLLREGTPEDATLASVAADAARQVAPASGQVRWILGETRLRQGRATEAIRLLEEAVALDPGDAAAWDALGRARLRAGRFREGLDAAARATGLRPAEGRYAVTFAEALLHLGESSRALQTLHAALGPRPHDPVVARAYADAHLRLARERIPGQEGWARRLLRAGLEIDPGNGAARDLLARLDRRFEALHAEARPLLEPAPDGTILPDNILLYATFLCRWGEFEQARPWFDVLLRKVGNAAVHYHYAREFWEGRRSPEGLEQAVRSYREALAREERYPEAWNGLWQVLRDLGRIREAANAARRYVELAPAAPDSIEAERFLESLPEDASR